MPSLRARASAVVLAALQRARTLFPFPLLGIDTDNGAEFINEEVRAYCEQEHLTFTRGRPSQKNDQCFIEAKNRSVVRQVVGYDSLVGEQAYQQLQELYRALRLSVNCFQPSMKLLSKQQEGPHLRLIYDPAKTPLQRLLLSGVLSSAAQEELRAVATRLDPLVLNEQIEQMQHAVWRCASRLTDHVWSVRELLTFRVAPPPWVAPKRRGRPPRSVMPVVKPKMARPRPLLRLRKGALCPSTS